MKISVFLFALMAFHLNAEAQSALLRHPAVNNNGTLVAFSYQGDIWTVPTAGGKASRLTIHEGYESNPMFSPDGKQIAFSGSRFGNNDIFVVPVEGGMPRRLTYHSAADNIASWQGNNNIVFSTAREFRQIERGLEVYAVSANGGTEKRILDAICLDPSTSPDGRFMALVKGESNPVFREDYRGPSNREIWIYDTQKKTYQKLDLFTTNDIMPQWADKRTLYFLSSDAGTYNLYRISIDENGKQTGKPEQLTQFKDEAVRYFSISSDGSTVVFEKETDLFLMKPGKSSPQKINIQISADDRFDPTELKTFQNGATQYAVSPNGKMLAYVVRGEVFIKEADKEKSRSINASENSFRDMDPEWLSDSVLLFTSDRADGNFDIYMVRSADTTERNVFKTLKHETVRLTKTDEDESGITVSPDGKKIAYNRGRGTLVVADINAAGKLANEKLLQQNGWAAASDMAWSPDSKWIAYSMPDLYFNSEIYIQSLDNGGKPVNVSMHPRTDRSPYWSADGSKLGFISERNNLSADIWFVWLKKEDWEKEAADWQEKETPPADSKSGAKAPVKPVRIDLEKIYERLVQVTSLPGDENNLVISKDGETFYYTATNTTAKGTDLYSVKWDGKDLKELTKGGSNPGNVVADREVKYLYFMRQGGTMARIDAKAGTQESLPYIAKLKIDYKAEREQVYEEAWRTIRDGFYDPNFHGYNWNKLHDKYKERCLGASTANDFRDMFNLMLGEINASHMAMTPADRIETQREATGLLGAELYPAEGGMKIGKIVPETPAEKNGNALKEGELITAVNGAAYKEGENFYEQLGGISGEKTLLTVKAADGKSREVIVRPVNTITTQLYKEWVDERKKLVEKYSGGRLGYIHIRGMDMPSFEALERDLTAAGFGKDGLIIDVRYNGGGSTTDLLMTVLNYKQHAYTVPRGASSNLERDKKKFRDYYPTGERLVYAAWMKPSIALCNESSYSNAEIFSHAYKNLGIGKLVGQPTNGSVISTGGRQLMDGSFVRLPGRGWFTKVNDQNQELGPAMPDILVENEPDWIGKGTDQQLKVAVETLIKEIGK
ncbi:MAG TPA: S41 family peptidase [Chitinophagaceae bacterium]|nr:S41 family peptidase [Chitinophagaceae bacterium]